MKRIHCYTSVSFSYLARARVLAKTLSVFHPDWVFWLVLSDRPPPGFAFDLAEEPFDHILHVEDVPVDNPEAWIFQHDVVELCTAVKGAALEHILSTGAEIVVYLDPDIGVLGPLDPVLAALERDQIVLTPHQVEPEVEHFAIRDQEISSLKHGTYNLGFLAVRNDTEGRRFARWWRERLISFCMDDVPNGLFTDQKWCDLVPAYFGDVGILRDPGFNVASWNISRRRVVIERSGEITVNGLPLRFFHFTKIDHVGEAMIEKYGAGNPALYELVAWYKRELERARPAGLPGGWWYYGAYENGTPITRAERRLYRARPDLQQRYPAPFSSAGDGYQAWYAAQR